MYRDQCDPSTLPTPVAHQVTRLVSEGAVESPVTNVSQGRLRSPLPWRTWNSTGTGIEQGRQGHVELVAYEGGTDACSDDGEPDAVVKEVHISDTAWRRYDDHSQLFPGLRELAIHRALSTQLCDTSRCFGFPQLLSWWITPVAAPPLSGLQASESRQGAAVVAKALPKPRCVHSIHSSGFILGMEMEWGGSLRLTQLQRVTCRQWVEILFQVLYALHVAQTELGFVHADLHGKNVVLHALRPGQEAHVHWNGQVYVIGQHGSHHAPSYVARIVDFGLSRCNVAPWGVLWNTANVISERFSRVADVQQVGAMMQPVKISDRDEQPLNMRQGLIAVVTIMNKGRHGPRDVLQQHHVFDTLRKQTPAEAPEDAVTATEPFLRATYDDPPKPMPITDSPTTFDTAGRRCTPPRRCKAKSRIATAHDRSRMRSIARQLFKK